MMWWLAACPVLICGPGRHLQVNWRIGKTAHFTRTEIIEAVADNTIRVQPNEVLAFGCDVSCRRDAAIGCKTALRLIQRGKAGQLWEAGRL